MRLWVLCLLVAAASSHKCCDKCACQQRCEAPEVHATLTPDGLRVDCADATCACVMDELDTCTYGETWTNITNIEWKDPVWNGCIQLETMEPLRARALIRWWNGKCMGHIRLELDIHLEPVVRDTYMDFDTIEFHEHATIYNAFKIRTVSGSEDPRPMAGSSTMYFEAVQPEPARGVHVEITDCKVQITEGKDMNAVILNEVHVFDPTRLVTVPGGMRLTYTAFWDAQTNSPFQRLVCDYALYNGTDVTNVLLHNTVNRTYRMADPNENGILVDDVNNVNINL